MVHILKYILIAGVAAIGAYMLYDAFEGPPPVVVEEGRTFAKSRYSAKQAERPTRKLQRGKLTYWEVSTPEGGWIDCAGDCAETYRRKVLDFWETRSEEDARGK